MKIEICKMTASLEILLFLLLVTSSCLDEKSLTDGSGSNNERVVSFSLTLPAPMSGGSTYALTTSDEEEVETIDVLLFSEGRYVDTKVVSGREITGMGQLKRFTVKIPAGVYSSLVVLANSSDILSQAELTATETKERALAKLHLSQDGKWITNREAANYRAIPMWGELSSVTIDSHSSTEAESTSLSLSLTRMLAKVSVALTSADAISHFQLKSIHVYNYYNRGLVAPAAANWGSGMATAASIPVEATKPTATNPYARLHYVSSEITVRDTASTGEIYLFESDNAKQTDPRKRTCLVLGGIYTGDGRKTYYRVDFVQRIADTDRFLDLLRNHHYKFNVTQISGPGYQTPDEAFAAPSCNIKATVITWNDLEVSNLATNGQYMLGVSQMEYRLSEDAYTASTNENKLTIVTDYFDGWRISSAVDATTGSAVEWLHVDTADLSGTTASKTISLLLNSNDSQTPRSANLLVQAGNIRLVVRVTQAGTPDLTIRITDLNGKTELNELIFPSGLDPAFPIEPKHFMVTWAPKKCCNNIRVRRSITGEELFCFAPNSQAITPRLMSEPSGVKQYTIQPLAMSPVEVAENPFLEKSSEITFQVINGSSVLQKSIRLRQINYALLVRGVDTFFLLDGANHFFSVHSNTPWMASITHNPDRVLTQLLTTSGRGDEVLGESVHFTTADFRSNSCSNSGTFDITFTSVDGKFLPKTFRIFCVACAVQPSANTYLIAPNGPGILIPVSRCNESMLGTVLGRSDRFNTELVWIDNSNRIAPNSAIKKLRTIGIGRGGHILVVPGSAEGNAVVALTNARGVILWSWHIWVTNYAAPSRPVSGTFMDRNLGAVRKRPGLAGTKGLLYQWGRKDPFPGSTTIDGNLEPRIYTTSGETSIVKEAVSFANNFLNSVRNPRTFYTAGATLLYNWYSNNGTWNSQLWGCRKTVYDPCPVGWRTPSFNFGVSPWSALHAANFTFDAITRGRTSSRYGGFYPAAGYRDAYNGSLTYVGRQGAYWSASGSTATYNYALDYGIARSAIYPSSSAGAAYGFSVRCVAE